MAELDRDLGTIARLCIIGLAVGTIAAAALKLIA